jgi:hypothetical protein
MREILAPLLVLVACTPTPAYFGPPASSSGSHYLTKDEIAAIDNVFPTTLVPPRDAVLMPMYERMRELQNPDGIGKLVSTLISLGARRVPITVEQCGEIDAHYNPNTETIRICYEFIANANRLAGKPETQWFALDQTAASILIFVALHEIGHALVDVFDLTFRGNEEDLADQFAFLLMTNVNDTDLVNRLVAAPAAFFYHHGQENEHRPGDVHSPSGDRAFEAMCLLYGRHRDPGVGKALGPKVAAGCVDHAAAVVAMWNQLLEPHTRIDTGRTF